MEHMGLRILRHIVHIGNQHVEICRMFQSTAPHPSATAARLRPHCFSKSWPTLFIGAKDSQAAWRDFAGGTVGKSGEVLLGL